MLIPQGRDIPLGCLLFSNSKDPSDLVEFDNPRRNIGPQPDAGIPGIAERDDPRLEWIASYARGNEAVFVRMCNEFEIVPIWWEERNSRYDPICHYGKMLPDPLHYKWKAKPKPRKRINVFNAELKRCEPHLMADEKPVLKDIHSLIVEAEHKCNELLLMIAGYMRLRENSMTKEGKDNAQRGIDLCISEIRDILKMYPSAARKFIPWAFRRFGIEYGDDLSISASILLIHEYSK